MENENQAVQETAADAPKINTVSVARKVVDLFAAHGVQHGDVDVIFRNIGQLLQKQRNGLKITYDS
jgi:hypothetical protein